MKTMTKKEAFDDLKLAQLFEVEELEERVEFGRWSTSAEGTGGTCGGGNCKFKAKFTVKIPI